MTPMSPSICLRCEKEDAALGSFFCPSCQAAITAPETPRSERGKPVARRTGPQHNRKFNRPTF